MSIYGLPLILFEVKGKRTKMGDLEFLTVKQFDNKLIKTLSAEFTGNAVQITRTPASGKTFYFLKAKLYPVVNTISAAANTTTNRRTDVEIRLNGVAIDVLTFDMEALFQTGGFNGGGMAKANQLESLIVDSMDGNGTTKKVELVSTNTSGTFRVSLLGIEENTGTSPQIPAI